MLQKKRVIRLPNSHILASTAFQKRLEIALSNLTEAKGSDGHFTNEVIRTIRCFEGKLLLANGAFYPRADVIRIMQPNDRRRPSRFKALLNDKLHNQAHLLERPRRLALYCYVAIKWPRIAAHIVK